MQQLVKLRALVLAGKSNYHILSKVHASIIHLFLECPIGENEDYRLEVLIAVRRLERLDKDQFTEDERTEAEEIFEQRRLKEIEDAAAAAANGDQEGGENVEQE